ncbi:hypothetical protein [Planktotalea sp.]|uniref:hypothetical protein n=1 Tax=Planktotalea sp. TaxID=2029877 RepID=UPI003D6A26D3
MARFTYHGPAQTVSLAVGKAKDKDGVEKSKFKDINFVPGKQTPDLPEGNPLIASMIDSGKLKPVEEKSKAPTGGK